MASRFTSGASPPAAGESGSASVPPSVAVRSQARFSHSSPTRTAPLAGRLTVDVPRATSVCEASNTVASMIASPMPRLVTFRRTAAGNAKGTLVDPLVVTETV
jgi:hypothetical protein